MFNNQNVGERGGSRPFVVGLVLLLLFLSTTQDWGSPPRNASRKQLKDTYTPQEVTDETKETIIRNLVKSNEQLEAENGRLRLELATLRSALKSGRSMNTNVTDESEGQAATDTPPTPNVASPSVPPVQSQQDVDNKSITRL